MKWRAVYRRAVCIVSLPVRGAWVEIGENRFHGFAAKSLPVRGAWVEMATCPTTGLPTVRSLPVRGAWVEIVVVGINPLRGVVAPRAGSVG